MCTPSRSAFLTGKYPIHLGMQHLVILEPEPWGLPLNETLLPQRLKNNGYKTHAIGKWHLGFHKKEYTPTYRGFDSHFGYWQGFHDYYDHTIHATYSNEQGYDMRKNMTVDWDAKGKYSTTLFTDEAVRIIKEHNADEPMFMYFAHLAPHAGNDQDPLQAPDEEIAKFAHIVDPERRIYAAMMSMMDRSVGEVVNALREKRMLHNTIIIFMSDNGGATVGIHANTGSNYPFRGMKNSAFEGAMRCAAAIWSPLIKKPQRVYTDLMHISDWLPTLYSAAGLNKSELGEIDGIDMWESISQDKKGPRSEILYNIDDVWKYGAIRRNKWKYLYGSVTKKDYWYGTAGTDSHYHYDIDAILDSKTGTALAGITTYQQIHQKHNDFRHKALNKTDYSVQLLDESIILRMRGEATVRCKDREPLQVSPDHQCHPSLAPCLFNLKDDPCELVNVAKDNPLMMNVFKSALNDFRKTAIAPINVPRDPKANPIFHNGTWTNWNDIEDIQKERVPLNILSPLAIGLITMACLVFLIVIAVLIALSLRRNTKYKDSDIFSSLEDARDKPTTELTMKTCELSRIPYRETTIVKSRD
ncbi:arylsulfatase [Holotrichia oblita]|uniref:Arylsulfatase n=1 Tax=Holotrichia oblita TaxID=644536 RepID=A0ACB9T6S3_HOLOL|nr:arylsulfatase [Holotrichia oblita]